METCLSNLTVLELLGFNAQKFRGRREHGHASRSFRKNFKGSCPESGLSWKQRRPYANYSCYIVFAPRSHNVGNLVQGEHPKIRMEYGCRMKIDPYYHAATKTVVQWLVCGNISFMRIFAGFPWGGVKRQWGNRKHGFNFQGFRTLRLRHLRKWDQHYYIVLFSPLSPFHWSQNTHDLEWYRMAWMAILR